MNHPQKRRIAATFQHVEKLLRAAEDAVAGEGAGSPFSPLVPDATPQQRRRVAEGARQAHACMAEALQRLGIPAQIPQVPATRSAYTDLMFAEVDLEDIAPARFKGYGALTDADARALDAVLAELLAILRPVRAALAPEDEGGLR
jgi:hypothetical protein